MIYHNCLIEALNKMNQIIFEEKSVYFFGVSDLGEYVLETVKKRKKVCEVAFIDNNAHEMRRYNKYDVYAPQLLREKDASDCIVLIISSHVKEMGQQLEEYGFILNENYYVLIDLLEWNERLYTDFRKKYASNIELTTDEIKLSMINVLKMIKDICNRNHLRYYLSCGTLLGAVRHGGFIPWDLDIDVNMPVDDAFQLYEIMRYDSSLETYSFFDGSFKIPLIRIGEKRIIALEKIATGHYVEYCSGVDIKPLIGKGNTFEEVQTFDKQYYEWWNEFGHILIDPNEKVDQAAIDSFINMMTMYEYNESNYFMQTNSDEFLHRKKEWYEPASYIQYEGEEYRVPGHYEYCLNMMYGDYMKLPPENEREAHRTTVAFYR